MATALPPPQSQPGISRSVLVAALLYLLAWSLLPPLLAPSFPLDVVESLTWGREWQWGYYKHPPLSPWVLHLAWLAFGKVGPFLLSQLCIAATLWCVWRTGCRLMAPERAFIGTVLTMGVAFYNYPALEFNHNIAQMPLWAALGLCQLAALQDGRLRQWLALGVLAGLGLLTKYSVGVLLACLGLYLVLSQARRVLRQPGPWLALAVALAVLTPHLVWLWQSDWLPMTYAINRSAADAAHNPRLSAVMFLATQALNHLPLALIVLVAALGTRRTLRLPAPQSPPTPVPVRLHTHWPGYLLTLALGSGLLVTLLGVVLGLRLRDMWGGPMWAFSGLLVAASLPTAWLAPMQPRLLRGLAVWLVLVSLLAGAYLATSAHWRHRPARTDWPAAALGAQAEATWNALAQCPLDTVAGNYWLAGLTAVDAPDRPSILIDSDPRYSPWITPQRLQAHGALWIWQPGAQSQGQAPAAAPRPLDQLQPGANMRLHTGVWNIPWPRDPSGPPLTAHWRAYVPTACAR
ncbi:MAG: glycosyltransferase family 39 protein [Giesbergeria sp.]